MSKAVYKTFELINKPDINGIITDDYNNKYTYSSVLKCIKDGEFFYNDLILRSSLIQGTGEYPDNVIGKMDEFYKDEYKAKFRIFNKYNGINFDKFKIDIDCILYKNDDDIINTNCIAIYGFHLVKNKNDNKKEE